MLNFLKVAGLVAVIGVMAVSAMQVHVASAQVGANPITLTNPLGASCNDLSCPIKKVIDFLFTLAIPICGIMILVGGFQMMTAGGQPEKFSKGKKTILYAVIGFVVILLAGSVAALIQSLFGGP